MEGESDLEKSVQLRKQGAIFISSLTETSGKRGTTLLFGIHFLIISNHLRSESSTGGWRET